LEVMVFWHFAASAFAAAKPAPWYSLCTGPEQKCSQPLHPTLGLGRCSRGPKVRYPASFRHVSCWQAPRQKGDQCGSM